MPVNIGMQVRSSDGQKLGVVKFMVLDSFNARVKSVVVERGHLIHHDVEIPVKLLRYADADTVDTTYSKEEYLALPEYDEEQYTTPPMDIQDAYGESHSEPASWLAAPPGLATPVAYGAMNYPLSADPLPTAGEAEARDAIRISARDNAVIKLGANVVTRSGDEIGKLSGATIDLNTERLIDITVRSGYFDVDESVLSGSAVESADTGYLYLNLEAETIERAISHGDVRAVV